MKTTETNTVQHTQGEVKVRYGTWDIITVNGLYDSDVIGTINKGIHLGDNEGEAKANAERFVTCWNEYDKLKKDNEAMLKVLKAISNYADSVNARSDFYDSPLVADVKAVIKEVEQK